MRRTRGALLPFALLLATSPVLGTEPGPRRARFPTPSASVAPMSAVPIMVVAQIPRGLAGDSTGPAAGALRSDIAEGGRLVLVTPGRAPVVLTSGFASAADPDISFDAQRILFAGKKEPSDPWCVFEMNRDGANARKITCGPGEARHPVYLSTVHTLTPKSTEPWVQLAFVGYPTGALAEDGLTPASSIYTSKFDGSTLRRIGFSLSHETDPVILWDGRLVYSAWRAHRLGLASRPRVDLISMNLEGSDPLAYLKSPGRRVKHMAASTPGGLVVFVETDSARSDGGGSLGAVDSVRNTQTYRPLTDPGEGLFRSPSAFAHDEILVAHRPGDGSSSWAIHRLHTLTKRRALVFDDPAWDEIQAKALAPRAVPDDRSTPIREDDPDGKLYGIDVAISDLPSSDWPKGLAKRIRVLEGVQRTKKDENPGAVRRLLGEAQVAADGSFHVQVPANIPIEVQLLDSHGMALRSCAWIATRNRFNQGCIGCHEDPERTPPNRFVDALRRDGARLNPPPELRRTSDFRHDVFPIVKARCASCHGEASRLPLTPSPGETEDESALRTFRLLVPTHVVPGAARTSRLAWHILGRNTARPWDGDIVHAEARPMPPGGSLTDDERQVILEWIDFGAAFDAKPAPPSPSPAGDAR